MSQLIFTPPAPQVQNYKLQNYRPSFWTEAGLVQATWRRNEFNKKNRITGIYDLVVTNPQTGVVTSTRCIYGLDQFGNPVLLKQFPPRRLN